MTPTAAHLVIPLAYLDQLLRSVNPDLVTSVTGMESEPVMIPSYLLEALFHPHQRSAEVPPGDPSTLSGPVDGGETPLEHNDLTKQPYDPLKPFDPEQFEPLTAVDGGEEEKTT